MAHASRPQRLADLLNGLRGTASLVARNRYHAQVQRVVQRRLPGFLAERCRACVVNHGHLTVYTDSPAWATQLRFALPAILLELQKVFDPQLHRVQVHILSPQNAHIKAKRQPMVPGRSVIRQLQYLADCSDPELGASLSRLAATWRRLRG